MCGQGRCANRPVPGSCCHVGVRWQEKNTERWTPVSTPRSWPPIRYWRITFSWKRYVWVRSENAGLRIVIIKGSKRSLDTFAPSARIPIRLFFWSEGDLMRRRFSLFVLFLFFFPAISPAKELPKIAVWDLDPRNIPQPYARELTSILASEVSKLEKYEVYSK